MLDGGRRSEISFGSIGVHMWLRIACALIVGYLCMGRSFAYWGFHQWNLFLGEVVLGWLLLWGPMSTKGRWPWIGMRSPHLHRLTLWMFFLLVYGVFEVLRGWMLGHPALTSVRDLAFNCYPFYLFLGIWVGLRRPASLAKYVHSFAWINGLYGIAFVSFSSRLGWRVHGTSHQVAD